MIYRLIYINKSISITLILFKNIRLLNKKLSYLKTKLMKLFKHETSINNLQINISISEFLKTTTNY